MSEDNLKYKLWRACINKNSMYTTWRYLVERQQNRRVKAG